MKKLYYIIYIGIFMLLLAGCQDEGMFTPESDGNEPVYVTYRVHMGDETLSRAIGDGKQVNELKVGVFEGENLQKVFTFKKDVNTEAFTNVTLPLLKQKKYNLVFWAQKKDNGIYTIDENFNITVNYAKYQDVLLAETEEFEAFTVVKKGVSVDNPGDATITLTRPFAQLNIAASEDDIFNKVNKVSFSINEVYTKFHPLMGVSSEGVVYNQEFSYSFSDQDISDMQAITIDGANYYYLASAYLLAPEKVSLTGGIYKDTELVKELNVTELPLKANSRTNIYGDMIQQEELEPWDGITFTAPELKDNQYIIDEESDIAWLTVPSNVASLSASTFIVTKDVLNMDNKTISSIQLPAGSTFNGNGKTIKYYANSLFGDATNITVQNLNLDNVTATSDSHVGVLVNTLTGSSTFTGISITNSSATTTNGAAGGMIGYITNKEGETLQVTISACTTTGNAVDGSLASGIYVGRFRGYDNSETLTFSSDNNASSATTTTGKSSYYVSDNVAAWLSENDYSKYSGFLGDEEFYRGTVMYGSNRFIPCWDGTTKVTPLTDGTTKLIFSAFDLASLQETAAGDIKLMENVDMDNKTISSIQLPAGSTFDGNGKTIKCYANSLFGDATNITVKNLTLDNVTATSDSHVGVLVNTLTGSSTFTGISITNSSATTTNGAAGGMIGYITNKKDERLNVTISACTLTDNIVDGSLTSGVYVGRFRGYDNNETLTFSSCNESSATINGTEPYYVEGNEATWLANNDYSNYSGWLGNEEFYRGTVMYGSNRFIPCWDGKNKITPLTDGNKTKLIYSAFDLASLQGTAAGDIKLMENVDMEHDLDGASKDGVRNHIFKALSTLTKLNGNGKTIYNITIRDNYYGGFVKSESCATTFENVTFDGADIRVTHDTSEGNAYVGTLRGFAYAATTINNVHVKNGYLNGVCKIGGLCGGIFSKITCSNSTVSNYSIENYDSQIISAGFKANGEIGGLIGYITVLDANTVNEISNCTVSDNNFNCVTYSASAWDRSVAPFIGDIRTQQAGTVKINNCQILGTNTYTNASNGETASFDQHRKKTGGSFLRPTYTYYPLVGQCYNVIIIDKKGKVYIDNTQIN